VLLYEQENVQHSLAKRVREVTVTCFHSAPTNPVEIWLQANTTPRRLNTNVITPHSRMLDYNALT